MRAPRPRGRARTARCSCSRRGRRSAARRACCGRSTRAARCAGSRGELDLAPLYAELGRHFAQLNVEGATVCGDELLLAQRGNSAEGINAIVVLDLAAALAGSRASATLDADAVRAIERHDLPEIDGVPASFTDLATLPDGRSSFTACAEATDDPVSDGAFVGRGRGRARRGAPPCSTRRTRSRACGRAAAASSCWSPTPTIAPSPRRSS